MRGTLTSSNPMVGLTCNIHPSYRKQGTYPKMHKFKIKKPKIYIIHYYDKYPANFLTKFKIYNNIIN